MSESFGFCYIRRPDLRAYKKSGNLRYAFARTTRRIPGHPGRRLRAAPRLSRRDASLPGRPGDRDRPDAPVLPGQRRADLDRERRGRDPGGVLPVDPGGPRPVRRGHLRRDLRGLPADCAGAAGRPDAHPLRRGRAHRTRRAPGRLVHGLPADRALDRDLPGQPRRIRAPAVPVVHRECRCRVLAPPVDGADDGPGPAHLHLRVLLLRLHQPADLLRRPSSPSSCWPSSPARSGCGTSSSCSRPCSPGSSCTRLWHRSSYGPSVWSLGIARGWAHVFAIWDSARGKTMGWHPTRTPGSSLRRFRIGVSGWSGGMALLWVAWPSGGR